MKQKLKKTIYIIFLISLFLIPTLKSEAFTSTNEGIYTEISDSSGSGVWVYSTYGFGVRLSLYQYDEKNLQFIASVDIVNSLKSDYDVLWINQVYTASNHSRYGYNGSNSVKFNNSINGIKFKTTSDYGLSKIKNSNNIPWNNVFDRELKEYFSEDEKKAMSKVKEMFGENIKIASANYDTFYIVAEPTGLYWNNQKRYWWYGTGYEFMSANINGNLPNELNLKTTTTNALYNAMYVAINDDLKKEAIKLGYPDDGRYDKYNFVNDSENSNGLVVAAIKGNPTTSSQIEANIDNTSYPYGIGIFWLASFTTTTCVSSCSGTDEFLSCAEKWCASNENNNYNSCVNSCVIESYDSPGCEDVRSYNQCYDATNNSKEVTIGGTCSNTEEENISSGSTKICYDDISNNYKTEEYVVDKNASGQFLMNTVNQKISYYKIECSEDFKISEISPTKKRVLVNENGTANLYLGYTLEYDKNCQIYYKSANDTWTKDYNSSKAKADSSKYTTWINELTTLIFNETDSTEKNRLTTIKSTLETMKTEVDKVKTEAESKLEQYKDINYADGISSTNEAILEILNEEGVVTKTVTVSLEPVSCLEEEDSTASRYCDLTTNTEYIINEKSNTIYCETSSGKQTATITNDKTASSFHQKIYYALPDSYTSTITVDMGDYFSDVFHDKQQCLDAVSSQNGQCITVENAWVFDPFNNNVTNNLLQNVTYSGNYQIRLKNWGSCAQFNFDLSCDYTLESSSACANACSLQYSDPTSDEYLECLKTNCGCDAYCGSNVACRNKYCPQSCDRCNDKTLEMESCGDNPEPEEEKDIPTCVQTCDINYDDEDYVTCKYNNCCRNNCNGNVACLYGCCYSECQEKYGSNGLTPNSEQLNLCLELCLCENGSCEGDNYLYRTINMDNPFPGSTDTTSRRAGANWYGKVAYITNTDTNNTKYADTTDGRSDAYEYKFTLDSKVLNNLKNNYSSYLEYNKSTKAISTISSNAYCSSLIHEELNNYLVKGEYSIGSKCEQ